MSKQVRPIFFLGNGRCYHTLDWFRSAQTLTLENPPVLVTDLIESESFEKLIKETDLVKSLLILDKVLLKNQSRVGNYWRNLLKFMVLPIQAIRLLKLVKQNNKPVIHAHSMYYIMLARFSGCKYVATPQGSEIIVRPYNSFMYKMFSKVALSRAACITVDSTAMQKAVYSLYGLGAEIVQNGIDLDSISKLETRKIKRDKLLSIRGITPNYQTGTLIDARNDYDAQLPIHFCYPFIEEEYKESVIKRLISKDKMHGRLAREDLYRLMLSSKLVFSIPFSDSSPRSVYEAIFCGCIVAVTQNEWIATLPACMRERILVVDTKSRTWFAEAISNANLKQEAIYSPSKEALKLFDQKSSMSCFLEDIYPALQ